jgi:hypothetical protein
MRRILFNDNGTPKTLLQLIQAKNTAAGRPPARRADLRFGPGPNGQVFILNKQDGTIRVLAPGPDASRAHLSPLPATGGTVRTITGSGSVTAILQGTRLTIDGTFAGLAGPATEANLRQAPKAIRGPALFDLEVTKAPSGRVTGTVELTPSQIDDLRNERLYVQIHSEAAAEGSVRGWLLR